MFADDTVLLTGSNYSELLDINTYISVSMAQQYCDSNDLVFNSSKTKLLALGRLKDELTEPPDLQRVGTTKHLGVILDECLSWKDHVDQLCSRLNYAVFALKRIKAVATSTATKTAYHAIFESHLRYGIILWGGSTMDNLERVLIAQKRAVRVMAGLQPRDSCREAFKSLGILTVVSIYIIEVINHAASRGNLPRMSAVHDHHTRHGNDFSLPIHRTALFSKKPCYAGAKLFNLLPQDLKNCDSKTLKRRLLNWLKDRSIYTLDEFKTSINSFH
ncbi:uncharacterized protein LOC124370849 [Homalodisca vitripennis]|uniref:uncharacterized protein LOC124370849 n=1 Tax=Homalodisca vitripennis TaxID=197043 RepID=UPI001EE9C2F1|nr:uncharacterized protein LOC124370849 [Homalodisca vitripennis]